MVEDGSNTPAPAIPLSLRLVGWITILYGISSILNIIELARHGRFFINLSALQFFGGIGILRRKRGWRLYQLFCLWLGLALLVLAGISIVSGRQLISYGWMGIPLERARPEVLLSLFILLALLTVWEIRVLTRSEVKKLFGISGTR